MNDLIEFLKAQLDDDERVAQAATRFWHGVSVESATMAEEDHVRRFHPARVLAEVDAKRRIIDTIASRLSTGEGDGGWESADAETDGMASTTLRLLALPYAARPGYREEWAL